MGCRLFWDEDTDSMAQDTFINDTLFCVAVGGLPRLPAACL